MDTLTVDFYYSDQGGFVDISSDAINNMKLFDLWYELNICGSLLRGKKAALVSGLHQCMFDCAIIVDATTTIKN